MRVVNQISFEARDDADALRLAAERLGKDAVILSTRAVRVGGILGFFQRSVLMVTAGILEEEPKKESRARDACCGSPSCCTTRRSGWRRF